MQTGAAEVVSHWITFAFAKLSGRSGEPQAAMEALVKMREFELADKAETQRQWLEHDAGWRDQLFALANRLAPAAVQAGDARRPFGR